MINSILLSLNILLAPSGLHAIQDVSSLAARLTGMTAVSGFEQAMSDSLIQLLPGAQRDRAGNVIAILGDGQPVRAAVCPMDEPGYVVGGIQEEGYVTLRRVGSGIPPYFDQGHAGHRVTIWGGSEPVPAVVSIPSTHLRRGRSGGSESMFDVDEMYLDLGATSPDDVGSRGVRLLNPVALEKQPHRYGESLLSGLHAGQRSACAALIAAHRDAPRLTGSLVVAFTVESRIGHRGVYTLLNGYGPFESTLLVAYHGPRQMEDGFGDVVRMGVETRYTGWQVETVDLTELQPLVRSIREWMRGTQ
jgi:putative aminopeptidase FrvX